MPAPVDISALYALHRDALLRYFARRTADAEVALDLVAETFAQAVRGRHRCRASSDDERAAWLYAIARGQLASYHRRGYAEQRAVRKLGLERPPARPRGRCDPGWQRRGNDTELPRNVPHGGRARTGM